jgi:hypothetical protein
MEASLYLRLRWSVTGTCSSDRTPALGIEADLLARQSVQSVSVFNYGNFGSYGNSENQSDCPRLAGRTIPFIRKYSTIRP